MVLLQYLCYLVLVLVFVCYVQHNLDLSCELQMGVESVLLLKHLRKCKYLCHITLEASDICNPCMYMYMYNVWCEILVLSCYVSFIADCLQGRLPNQARIPQKGTPPPSLSLFLFLSCLSFPSHFLCISPPSLSISLFPFPIVFHSLLVVL